MDAGVVETFGKYNRILAPGCHIIMYPLELVSARVSLKIKHTEISCDTKSRDNVFVTVVVAGNSQSIERAIDLFAAHNTKYSVRLCLST